MLNERMSKLTELREHLDARIARPERPPELTVEDLLQEETVPVHFEKIDGKDLTVSVRGYGLATDVPRSERRTWGASFDHLETEANQFVRKPRRVLARAVYDARAKTRDYLDEEYVLSDIDREEIEDELNQRVRLLTAPATAGILDRGRLRTMLDEQNRRVSRVIGERMRIGTIAAASLIVLLVWVAAFVPYLIQAGRHGIEQIGWSAFVVAAVIVVLAAVGIVTLILMRRRLVNLLHEVNLAMKGFVSSVSTGANLFGEYLSRLVTYLHARSVLIGADRQHDRERMQNRRYSAARNRAVDAITADRDIVTSLGVPLNVRRMPAAVALLDVDDARAVEAFFRLPTADGRAAFNESGEYVRAPYDFVRRLLVERVRVFESTRENGGAPR